MLLLLLYSVILIASIIICKWLWKYYRLRKTLSIIPGPKCLPFIGLSWQYIKTPPEDRLRWVNNLCRNFKKGMIMTWVGMDPVLVMNTPKYMEIILSSNTLIKKSRIYDIMRPWLGNGLITSTGNTWFRHRRLLTPAFFFNVLEEYTAIMQDKVKILVESLESQLQLKKNQPINIFEVSIRYTLDTICEAAMGVNIDSQRKPDGEYIKALHNFSELATERYLRFWLKWNTLYYCTKKGKEYLKSMHIMHNFTETVVHRKQQERKQGRLSKEPNSTDAEELGKGKRKAFLDLLLDASGESENPLTFQEIREEVDTFMFAGHDTTAAAITWTLFAIGNAPEVQTKVREEIEEIFDTDTGIASTKQLSQLKYLDRVIKETLRLYPSVPIIGRYIETDTIIDGILIPKGTLLNMHIYQLHRNPEVWEDPEKFDPDRFLPENIRSKSPYAYVPFSAGPRNCIGQKFALLEVKTVLTAILRKWRISSVLKPSEVKMVLNFILRPHEEYIGLYLTPIQ